MNPNYRAVQGLIIALCLLKIIDKDIRIVECKLTDISNKVVVFHGKLQDYYKKESK